MNKGKLFKSMASSKRGGFLIKPEHISPTCLRNPGITLLQPSSTERLLPKNLKAPFLVASTAENKKKRSLADERIILVRRSCEKKKICVTVIRSCKKKISGKTNAETSECNANTETNTAASTDVANDLRAKTRSPSDAAANANPHSPKGSISGMNGIPFLISPEYTLDDHHHLKTFEKKKPIRYHLTPLKEQSSRQIQMHVEIDRRRLNQ